MGVLSSFVTVSLCTSTVCCVSMHLHVVTSCIASCHWLSDHASRSCASCGEVSTSRVR